MQTRKNPLSFFGDGNLRLLFITLLAVGLAILLGCMGASDTGGGNSAGNSSSPADNAQISNQLQLFVKAAKSGDSKAMTQFYSRRMQTLTGSGETVQLFTLWDFGNDIYSTADDASFTFFLDSSQIEYIGNDLAKAHTWTHFSDGSKFNLDFQFVKENGKWLIDFLEVKSQEAGTTGVGGVGSSVDLFPLAKGNKWRYIEKTSVPAGQVASQAYYKILRIDTDPETRDPLKIFPVETADNLAPVGFDLAKFGAVTDTLEFGRTAAGKSYVEDGTFPSSTGSSTIELFDILDAKRLNKIRFGNLLGMYVYGGDASFNADQPWRMTGLVVKEGAKTEQSITFTDSVGNRTATLKTIFMGSLHVNLPFKSLDAVRLDISARLDDTGQVVYTTWLFEPGIGLVAQIHYDESTRQSSKQQYLIEGLVSGVPFSTPGTPANFDSLTVNHLVPATPIIAGVSLSHTFTITGGTPPYTWGVASAPTWLSLDSALGKVTMIPPQNGTFTFTLLVKDSGSLAASYNLQWFVKPSTDTVPPEVVGIVPGSGTIEVPVLTDIRVDFSKPMATFSFNPGAFLLINASSQAVVGSITLGGNSAFFHPVASLQEAAEYWPVVGTGVTDVAGNHLQQPFVSHFYTVGYDRPMLLSILPPAGATGIGTSKAVVAQFSHGMDLRTFSSDTFRVTGSSSTLIPGNVTPSPDNTFIYFVASPPFDAASTYSVLIGTTVRDLGGKPFGVTKTWSFTTDTAPTITRMVPPPGASQARLIDPVIVGFNRGMNVNTIVRETFVIEHGGVQVPGRIEFSPDGTEARFYPNAPLLSFATHTVTVASTVLDLNGSYLQGRKWAFLTGIAFDIATFSQPNGAVGVVTVASISVTFTSPVDRATVASNFSVAQGASPIAGTHTVSLDGLTVSFVPSQPLTALTVYSCKMLGAIRDIYGQSLGRDVLWAFTTDSRPKIVRSEPEINGAWSPSLLNSNKMTIYFDKPMKPSSINTTNFTIACETGGTNPTIDPTVPPTCSGNQATWTFNMDAFRSDAPGSPQTYKLTMGNLPTDLAGNPLDLFPLGGPNKLRFANTLTRTIGGSGTTLGAALAVDSASGDIIVVGKTNNSVAGNTWFGGWDIIVARFNPWGRRLWCVQIGTAGDDEAHDVALDSSGNIYVTGYTTGNYTRACQGSADVIAFKLNAAGTLPEVWKDQFGSTAYDQGMSICVVPTNNNVFVTGEVWGNFDGQTAPGAGANSDGFMVRYLGGNGVRGQAAIGSSASGNGTDIGAVLVADSTGVYRGGNAYDNSNGNQVAAAGLTTAGVSSWTQQAGIADSGVCDLTLATDVWVIGYTGTLSYRAVFSKSTGSVLFNPVGWPIGAPLGATDKFTGIAWDNSNFFISGTTSGNKAFLAKYNPSPVQQFGNIFGNSITGNSLAEGVRFDAKFNRILVIGSCYSSVPQSFDAFSGTADLFLMAFDRAAGVRK